MIKPRYEQRLASAQTIADIFKGFWKSKLPDGVESGTAELFADTRPEWFDSILPGGIRDKSVLELGPFEGYQTRALLKLGAREVSSVEGNTINFLKCLCRKEIDGLNVRMKLGDVLKELEVDTNYDVVFASGILYHMQEPLRFIELACQRAPAIYIWTHFFDVQRMQDLDPLQAELFDASLNRTADVAGQPVTLHARKYGIDNYRDNIPMYWEGAPEELTYWLDWRTIELCFAASGFRLIKQVESDVGGLPCVSFAALKLPNQAMMSAANED